MSTIKSVRPGQRWYALALGVLLAGGAGVIPGSVLAGGLVQADNWAEEDESWGDDSWGDDQTESAGAALQGFYELGVGGRLHNDPVLDENLTLAEARARLEYGRYFDDTHFTLKGDIFADGVEHGLQGDLREAMFAFSVSDNIDMRVGQQVLTWGTGDLLFLNDLFAKDWVSFFSGREDSYLKAPSASIKASYYGLNLGGSGGDNGVNLDLVWTPKFTHDRFIDGERFSYFSPMVGTNVAAPSGYFVPEEPDQKFENGEFAARLFGRQGSTEWALYGYQGFWKRPVSMTPDMRGNFDRLTALGASVRGNLAAGIAHAEVAWYEGKDSNGDDPLRANDQFRALMGYEQELVSDLTMGVQYYLEWTQDYDELRRTDGHSPYRPDEYRQVMTLRLSYRLMQNNLTLNWFSFWSPTDEDYYLRPSVRYRLDDAWSVTVGGNIFGGEEQHTFFGQFEDASNLYARLRYSY
ncbi:MAG: hypothetical protein OIF57_14230 [Marinobacterium sp.]|nr:hypothetical protein [Marinobacterium sp.]